MAGFAALVAAGPAVAIDRALAEDNIASEFVYWPNKDNAANEYRIPSGHNYRVWRGQVIDTVGGTVRVGADQVATAPGGLQVIFKMDHIISVLDDDNAAVTMTFDPQGSLIGYSVAIEPSKGLVIAGPFQEGGKLVAASVAAGSGSGAAAEPIGKATGSLIETLNKISNVNGGTLLLPAQISAVAQQVGKAVQAAAAGRRLTHAGRAIQGWDRPGCRGGMVGLIDDQRRSAKLTDKGSPFANDQIQSVRFYNNIRPGTLIQLFNESGGDHKKSWAEIVVDDPRAFGAVGECVGTLNENRAGAGIRVFSYKARGDDDLGGKVSRVSVFPPGAWTSDRRVRQ